MEYFFNYEDMYKIKIFPVSHKAVMAGHIPKYTFHVEYFEDGKFKCNATQTEDLINEIKPAVESLEIGIAGKELPFDSFTDEDGIKHFE